MNKNTVNQLQSNLNYKILLIPLKLYLSVYLDVQAYDFFSKWQVAVSTAVIGSLCNNDGDGYENVT